MIAGSNAAAKTEQEAKKVREADPFDVFQDIIHISPAQPVLFEGGSFCILLSDEERLSLTFEGTSSKETPSKKTPSKKTYREEVHSKASGEKTYSGELLTFYADGRFTVSSGRRAQPDGSGCSGIYCPIITQRQFFTSDRDLKNCWT